jgi:hypothetical protein
LRMTQTFPLCAAGNQCLILSVRFCSCTSDEVHRNSPALHKKSKTKFSKKETKQISLL